MNDLVFTTRTTDDLIFSTKLWAKKAIIKQEDKEDEKYRRKIVK